MKPKDRQKKFAEYQKRLGRTIEQQLMLIQYMYYYLGINLTAPRLINDIKDGSLQIILGADQNFYFHYKEKGIEAAISMDGYIKSDIDYTIKVDFTQ